ncbi:MAG: hypothetical protein WBC33_13080, partial [Conexibacter sp.]
MSHVATRLVGVALRALALGTVGVLLACTAAPAATTTYPAGAGTFDGGAQGWIDSAESCSMVSGVSVLCSADAAYSASGGNLGGALATDVQVTLNLLGLFEGSGTWTSPSFAIPPDANVSGATLAFDAVFAPGGLLNLGLSSDVVVTLVDETDAGTGTLTTVTLDDTDTSYAPQAAILPDGAIEAGHTYRLAFATTTTSTTQSIGVLGTASTRFDNVELAVTTQDAPTDGGGTGSGGGGGGGTGTVPAKGNGAIESIENAMQSGSGGGGGGGGGGVVQPLGYIELSDAGSRWVPLEPPRAEIALRVLTMLAVVGPGGGRGGFLRRLLLVI